MYICNRWELMVDPRIAAILAQAGMTEETFFTGVKAGKLGLSCFQ